MVPSACQHCHLSQPSMPDLLDWSSPKVRECLHGIRIAQNPHPTHRLRAVKLGRVALTTGREGPAATGAGKWHSSFGFTLFCFCNNSLLWVPVHRQQTPTLAHRSSNRPQNSQSRKGVNVPNAPRSSLAPVELQRLPQSRSSVPCPRARYPSDTQQAAVLGRKRRAVLVKHSWNKITFWEKEI